DHLSSAKFHLVAVAGEFGDQIALDLDPQLGVCQADSVADSRTIEINVLLAGILQAHVGQSRLPLILLLSPTTSRAPTSATSATSRSSPGSNRTAVPEGMLRRIPRAAFRSKSRASLTSRK